MRRAMADRTHGPLRLGERFLKYGIERLLGRGGHAWVYEGHDPFLERKVAVKVLHRPGGVTEDMLRRGRAEAKLLHRLKHPNIVDVFDAGMTESGVLYIVMELLAGTTLREVLRRRVRLPVREALRIFAAVADGVSAAHAAGAIHRDLKPENIVILDDGRAKVLDFGVAKLADSAGLTTEKDVIHGTMLYMSPEQLNGLRATARSDVYAVGLTLYESLAGRHPCLLKNQSPTIRELAVIQTSVRPPFVDELVSSIPRHVARLCDRAVTKVPAQRFASMSELRDALRESLDRCEKDGIGATEVFERSASVAPGLHHDTERMNVPAFTAERTAPPVATAERRAPARGARGGRRCRSRFRRGRVLCPRCCPGVA
jgi:serine/threonine-protein kinase